jgi:3-phytase
MKTLALAAFLLAADSLAQAQPAVETTPTPGGPTAANDTAVWVHPTDVSRSLIFGTNQILGALTTYNLNGTEHEVVPLGTVGLAIAVDVRYQIPFNGGLTDVVLSVPLGGNFRLFAPHPVTGGLVAIDGTPIVTGLTPSAAALYRNPQSHQLSAFIGDAAGTLQRWELVDDGQGHLRGNLVRTLQLGGSIQGIAADDRAGQLFLTLAQRGLIRLSVNLGNEVAFEVDGIDGGHLAGPTGVALYFTADGGGYVIASSSFNNRFSVYARGGGNPFVTSFSIVGPNGAARASSSSGIEVVPLSLGAPFTRGLFVAHDLLNNAGPNYKLVRWEDIAAASGALVVDPTLDPRVGFETMTPASGGCPIVTDGGVFPGDGGFDAGSVVFDAGSVVFDAGSVVFDAGSVFFDAGSVFFDAGSVFFDAGSVFFDAGSVAFDAGSVAFDAGSVAFDAGSVAFDAGSVAFDGGVLATDGGCPPSGTGGAGGSGPVNSFRPPAIPPGSVPPITDSNGCGCGQTLWLCPLAALLWLRRPRRSWQNS